MRYVSGFVSWLLLLGVAAGLVWLVQGSPAVVTVEGQGWRLQTTLAVVLVAQVALLVMVGYGVLLLHGMLGLWRRVCVWVDGLEMPWDRTVVPADADVKLDKPADTKPVRADRDDVPPPAAYS